MINNKTILAVIPARGGSKGLPRKNIKELAGKPLIAWTIEEAKKSLYIDRLVLSSESDEIIEVAQKWGCEVPYVRPIDLAQDDTPSMAVISHVIEMVKGYDYLLLLQPTSPLRSVEDIDGAIDHCINRDAKALVSVTQVTENPQWMRIFKNDDTLERIIGEKDVTRRQDLPDYYRFNGAIYFAECSWLLQNKSFITDETIGYKMPIERSIDIDTELDFLFTQFLLDNDLNISREEN